MRVNDLERLTIDEDSDLDKNYILRFLNEIKDIETLN